MTTWAISNGRGITLDIGSDAELSAAIGAIEEAAENDGEFVVANLTPKAEGAGLPYLLIMLGSQESVLVYEPGEGGLGSFWSCGADTDDETGLTARYGTGEAYFVRRYVIARRQAIDAAHEFYRTGRRPAAVDWVDD